MSRTFFGRIRSWLRRDLSKPLLARRPVQLHLDVLEDRITPSTVLWNVNISGNWNTAGDWSTGIVPGPGDDVIINQPGAVSVTISSGAQSVNSVTVGSTDGLLLTGGALTVAATSAINGAFTFGNGTLTANGALTLGGTSTWSGGTMTAPAPITNSGTLSLTGTGYFDLNGTLDNAGTITQVAASSYNTLYFDQNAELNNTGLYDIQENGTAMQPDGGSVWAFNNFGTVQKSGPATVGTAILDGVPLNNAAAGIINVTSGTLSLDGSGTDSGGTFTVAAGDTLDLTGNGSGNVLTGTYTGSGAGTVLLANGTLNIGTAGATFNFPANFFQWTGGTLNASPGALTNQAATGFITLSGISSMYLEGTLDNAGTITQVAVGNYNTLYFDSGAVLNNQSTGFTTFRRSVDPQCPTTAAPAGRQRLYLERGHPQRSGDQRGHNDHHGRHLPGCGAE